MNGMCYVSVIFVIYLKYVLLPYELVDMMLPLILTQRDHPISWDLLKNAPN